MRVAVFGYGSMGKRHTANARRLGHEVFVYDPNLDPNLTIGTVTTLEGMIWDRFHPESVIIASPASEHPSTIAACYERRIPFFVEKPVALSVAACPPTRLLRTQVGYNLRFHPHVERLRAHITALTPERAVFWIRCNMDAWPGTTYADALLECSHEIDLALYLLGPADLTGAYCVNGRWELKLQHASGVKSAIDINPSQITYERGCVIDCADGDGLWTWHAPSDSSSLMLDSRAGGGVSCASISADDTYRDELAAFFAFDEPPRCTIDDGLAVLTLCDKARLLSAQ